MFWEKQPTGSDPSAPDIGSVLRHPDGSVDIAAYAKLAHRARAAAMACSATQAVRMVREIMSGVRASFAPAAGLEPESEKHSAAARR